MHAFAPSIVVIAPRGSSLLRWFAALILSASLLSGASVVRADEEVTPPEPRAAAPEAPPGDAQANNAAATERYNAALALLEKKLYGPALAEAEESLRHRPSYGATLIAARCLKELGRFDESLVRYATLVRDFEDRLKKTKRNAAQYKAVLEEIEALRKLVGLIEIEGAVVGAMVVVDLSRRGDYPLLEPMRVPAGSHLVRVYKEGYEPFEQRVDVAGGTRQVVKASLIKLKASGTLRVVEATGKELDVVVDAFEMGTTPWEGLLSPGTHTVALRGEGELGTQPMRVKVERDATTPLELRAEKLSSELRVWPKQAGATVALDGVSVGRGVWQGKLRPGKHRVEIAEEGFVLQVRDVTLAEGKLGVIEADLERDPLSPLWKDNRGRFFVEADAGPSLVPTFGGDIARATKAPGFGGVVTARGGYRFPSGFLVGLDVGYGALWQFVLGREAVVMPPGLDPEHGTVDDTLSLRGVLLGVSGGMRLGKKRPLTLRLGVGALMGTFQDHREGDFKTEGRFNLTTNQWVPSEPYHVSFTQKPPTVISVYVAPEVRMGFPLAERLEFSVGLKGLLLVTPRQPMWDPFASRVNAKSSGFATFPEQDLMGVVVVAVEPGVGIRYEF